MNFEKQKNFLLDKLRDEKNLSVELKKEFEKQILEMNEEEFNFFIEGIKEGKRSDNLEERIISIQETENFAHSNFLQASGELLRKITIKKSAKQKISDKKKAKELLSKIN